MYVNSSSSVIYISDLEDLILSYHGKIFEEGEVERLVDKLIYSRSETKITYKAHARYAKERKYDYQWKIIFVRNVVEDWLSEMGGTGNFWDVVIFLDVDLPIKKYRKTVELYSVLTM